MAGQGPNVEWKTEMYRKAPIRRIQKKIPKTGDNLAGELLLHAIEHDNSQFVLERSKQAKEEHAEYSKQVTQELETRLDGKPADVEPEKTQFAADGERIPEKLSEGNKP